MNQSEEISFLRQENFELPARIVVLENLLRDALDKLGKNSTNSSKQVKYCPNCVKENKGVFSRHTFSNDVDFKNAMKSSLGNQVYSKKQGTILEVATTMNAMLILIGVLGFIACFSFSLGLVMWVMFSELFPGIYRGLAIGAIGFVNSLVSSIVQQIFPWELSTFGNAMSFFVFGVIALIGYFILLKILPETKGKSLEQIEIDLVRN